MTLGKGCRSAQSPLRDGGKRAPHRVRTGAGPHRSGRRSEQPPAPAPTRPQEGRPCLPARRGRRLTALRGSPWHDRRRPRTAPTGTTGRDERPVPGRTHRRGAEGATARAPPRRRQQQALPGCAGRGHGRRGGAGGPPRDAARRAGNSRTLARPRPTLPEQFPAPRAHTRTPTAPGHTRRPRPNSPGHPLDSHPGPDPGAPPPPRPCPRGREMLPPRLRRAPTNLSGARAAPPPPADFPAPPPAPEPARQGHPFPPPPPGGTSRAAQDPLAPLPSPTPPPRSRRSRSGR